MAWISGLLRLLALGVDRWELGRPARTPVIGEQVAEVAQACIAFKLKHEYTWESLSKDRCSTSCAAGEAKCLHGQRLRHELRSEYTLEIRGACDTQTGSSCRRAERPERGLLRWRLHRS